MNTKFRLLFTAFLCSISSVLFAQSVSINEARTIAGQHLENVRQKSLKSASSLERNFRPTSVKVAVENKDTLYYILNDTINKSFVIVSADKRVWPILGYSVEGSFNEKKQPEAFIAWMDSRKEEIESIKMNNLQPDGATVASWQNLSLKSATISSISVEPLIQTQWDQGCYYNQLCPSDAQSSYCGHVPTGCTITAMAQIMKYWNYPTKGTGSHSYSHPTYGNLSADFGSTTYLWSQMPNSVTSPNDAIATLMYQCGVSLETDYAPGGSTAFNPREALVQYFNYSSNAMLVDRSSFSTIDWVRILKSELDLKHPIWYQGSGSVGHAFVCDGYQDADYFHFNWGWGGANDGYFYINNLNPSDYSFNNDQYALLKILPGNLPDGYNGFFLSSKVLDIITMGGTASVDVCSSANWTASSDQSWLSLSSNTGSSGKTTFVVTATENQSGKDRVATVSISASGFTSQTITVNQFAKKSVTPGGLQNLIGQNATTITKLTLSGSIDARDFKTMRDAMPALTDVDLRAATISAYTGQEGTINDNTSNITYPANTIPAEAFNIPTCKQRNHPLKSIILPSTITAIDYNSFANLKYLSSIKIPSSVTSIGDMAFRLCVASINVDIDNPNYSSIDGLLFNKDQTKLLQCPVSKTGNYSIPSTVSSIRYYCFSNCSGLSSISVPSSVTLIENVVFYRCTALINVDANNPNYSSINGVLFNKDQTKLIQCPTSKTGSYAIPNSVTIIGNNAFEGCSGLANVVMPSSIVFIQNYSFYECSGLTKITIPSSVNSIEQFAFYNCSRLEEAIIPSSVKSLRESVFGLCKKLKSIYSYPISPVNLTLSDKFFEAVNTATCTLFVPFGSKLAYKESNQWKDFSNIIEMSGIFLSDIEIGMESNASTTKIKITSSADWSATSDQAWLTVTPLGGSTGGNTVTLTATANPTTAIRTARVTISSVGLTSQIIKVTQYGNVAVTAGNLKAILGGQLSTLKNLTLTGSIDARDFKTMRDEMPTLTDIDLSDATIVAYSGNDGPASTVTKNYPANGIPDYAFSDPFNNSQGKVGLNSIVLPVSVTSIGNYSFTKCEGLTKIDLPAHITSIGKNAFEYCTQLKNINIPSEVTSIGSQAFVRFNGLIAVDANNPKYSSIDGNLFNKAQTELIQCSVSKTGTYTIPSSVTLIGSYAFYYCQWLTGVIIPSSVISIGNSAFSNCTGLKAVTLPVSLISIGNIAFCGCSELTSMTIPSSVVSIGSDAFFGCIKLMNVTIPLSTKTIGAGAFSYSYALKAIYTYSASPLDLSSSLGVFTGVNKFTCTLFVPYGSKASYQSADQWKDFTNIVEMPGIKLSATTVNLKSAQGSTAKIDISANISYSVASDQTWLTVGTATPTEAGTLTFTATENTGSAARTAIVSVSAAGVESQTITVIQESKNTTGVDQLSNKQEFIVYPNPTTGKIKLVFDEIPLSGITVTLNDIAGKNCLTQLIRETESWIDLSGNTPGIYFIKTDQENFKAQKVILK